MEECNPQSPFGIFVDTKTPTRVEKKVSFVTSDNETVEISRNLCNLSGTMKNILDVVEENRTIPLPNVSAPILKKIVEFMVKYDRLSADETSAMDITEEASGCDSVSHKKVTAWEVEYTDIDLKMLSQLMMSANYLEIPPLLKVCARAFARTIKTQHAEFFEKTFAIRHDLTPEEIAEIRARDTFEMP